MKFVGSLCLCLLSTFADAADISIENAWARATPPGARTAAAYFVIKNSGEADRLVGVQSTAAEEAEVHTHVQDGDMLRMRHLPAFDLAPRNDTAFAPGGLHVMLMDLLAPLRPGDEFVMTLTFEKAGEIEVIVRVVDARKDVP